jgi:5-methyltetrahydropteroyltriglutamate--homocysteine methyltransferase
MVVLGLVTTKTPRRESKEELIARIDQASNFVPLERLAISPQCGFSSSILGNRISVEDQKYKLRVTADSAREVWGS